MTPDDPTNGSAAGLPAGTALVAPRKPAGAAAATVESRPSPRPGCLPGRGGGLSPIQLAAVLRVDQRERWRRGQPIPAEASLQRFPRVRDDDEGAADLVYGEFLLRERQGGAAGRGVAVAFPDAEADRTLLWLKQAAAAGYKDRARLKKDRDLDAVRACPEFKQLLADLEKP